MDPFPTAARRPAGAAVTRVWTLLIGATLLVGWLAEGHGIDPLSAVGLTFAMAAFKARLVLLHYMELRHAPLAWRLFFEAWAVIAAAGIVAGYWWTLPALPA